MELSAPIYRLKRKAKEIARAEKMPLHAALRRVAVQEGFQDWSLLAATYDKRNTAATVFDQLQPGERMLVAARPEQGKTLLASELLMHAINQGFDGHLFSLVELKETIETRLGGFSERLPSGSINIDTSNLICADHILATLRSSKPRTLVVIDYLQLLDQRRTTPVLGDQVRSLAEYAQKTGVMFVFLCQIDRAFDASDAALPKLAELRLPNPVDLGLFSKTCFLHNGKIDVEAMNLPSAGLSQA